MGAQTESVRGEPGSCLYLNGDGVGVNGNPLPPPIKVGRHRASLTGRGGKQISRLGRTTTRETNKKKDRRELRLKNKGGTSSFHLGFMEEYLTGVTTLVTAW